MKKFIAQLFGHKSNTNADTLAQAAMRRRRPGAHRNKDGSLTLYAEDGTPVVFGKKPDAKNP